VLKDLNEIIKIKERDDLLVWHTVKLPHYYGKKKSHSVVAHSFFDGFTSQAEEKVMIRPKMRHWPFSKRTIGTTANCWTPTPRLIGTTTPTWPTRTPLLSWVSGPGVIPNTWKLIEFFYRKKEKIFVSWSEFVWFLVNWNEKLRTDCDTFWVQFQHSNKF
jgi:hypothetical protein